MISVGNNKAVICKGDFHPAALYKGDKKIAGYIVESFENENGVTLENCYNDKLHNAQIFGNSIQDGTPTPENPVEIQSVGELVTEGEYAGKYKIPVMARGKNFIDKNNIKIISVNCRSYEKNDDLIIVQGNEGLAANAASAGNIRFAIPETLPSGTYTFSMYATLLEEGIWGTSASIYAGASLDTYSEKNFSYENNIVGAKTRIKFTATFSNGLGCVVMRLNSSKWLIDISSLQIEQGDTATPYEPYIEPQTFNIYLDEPLRKVGDYADYVDFDKDVVARKVRKRVFDGTEWWSFDASTKNNTLLRQEKVESYTSGMGDKITALCNRLKGRTWSRIWQNYYKSSESTDLITGIAVVYNANDGTGQSYLYFKVSPYSTLPTIAEWVSQLAIWYDEGNPFTVWYVIPTIEEPIELPELPTFKGTTIYEIATEIPATISGKYKKVEEL